MQKKKIIYPTILCAIALPFLTSCSDDDEPVNPPSVPSEYLYVLNSGKWKSNNASLSMYDVKEKTVTHNIFETQNGRRLGDTGQDMIVYGSKMYIAVSGESTIEVTDLEAKSVKQITTEGEPRSLATDEGKVYVTYNNGYVARIDTASLEVEAKIQVGRNPDHLVVAEEKLYVSNTGGQDASTELGYDNTISVIDLPSFSEIKKIEVVINPAGIIPDEDGSLYVVSMGNYRIDKPEIFIPNTLQKIDLETDEVTVMTDIKGTKMTSIGTTLYSVYAQSQANEVFYYSYDMENEKVLSDDFIGALEISNFFNIFSDEESGDLYILSSDYVNDGDAYILNKSGELVNKFETGLNPMKVVRIKK